MSKDLKSNAMLIDEVKCGIYAEFYEKNKELFQKNPIKYQRDSSKFVEEQMRGFNPNDENNKKLTLAEKVYSLLPKWFRR